MKLISLLSICLLFISLQLSAITERQPEMKKLNRFINSVTELHKKGLLDGEILITQNNEELLHLVSKEVNSTDEPKFMIGSVSKQFFAAALLKALYDDSPGKTEKEKVNEVRFKLQAPLTNFLPSNAKIWSGKMPKWASKVTLHQLLSHTSGIPNYTECDAYFEESKSGKPFCEEVHSSRDIIQLISKMPLDFTPGSDFSYSNTGYHLIAEVIETITDTPVSMYLQKNIFDPLKMTSTSSPEKGTLDDLKKDSHYTELVSQWLYDLNGDQTKIYPIRVLEDISNARGDGCIISTASDLLKWNQALHTTDKILPKSLYKLMITPNLEGYAYGVGINMSDLGKSIEHNGEIGASRTALHYYPELDLSIIVLCNISYDEDNEESREVAAQKSKRGYERIVSLLSS